MPRLNKLRNRDTVTRVLVTLATLSVLVALVGLGSSSSSSWRRRLSYMPPVAGEWTDYSQYARRVPGTSTRGISSWFFSKIGGSVGNITRQFVERPLTPGDVDASVGGAVPSVDPWAAGDEAGRHPHGWLGFEDRPLEDLFDVVIVARLEAGNSSNSTSFPAWTTFLEAWRPIIEPFNLIIVQPGDPAVHLPIPAWANFELYTRIDVQRALGEHAWIIDMDSADDAAAKAFAFMAGDREFIYILDTDSLPDPGGFNPIAAHAMALLTPSNPYYYNTLYDPHSRGTDFSRAYPYTLREGVPTGLSIGPSAGYPMEEDATSRLAKRSFSSPPPTAAAPPPPPPPPPAAATANPPLAKTSSQTVSVSQTVPHGLLFSLPLANVAFHRPSVGPVFYSCSAALARQAGYNIGPRNLEVLAGWILKVALDYVRLGVKHGAPKEQPGHVVMRPPADAAAALATELAHDVAWTPALQPLANVETLSRFFSAIDLKVKTHDSASAAMQALLDQIDAHFGAAHPFFLRYTKAHRLYMGLFGDQHGFHNKPQLIPVSSRSSLGPLPSSRHKCAVFTIMHDEPLMLPVWVRYYQRHFPGSVFVIDHQRNYSAQSSEARRANEVNVSSLQGPVGSGLEGRVRYHRLFGDQKGFPVHYFVSIAQLWMARLLRHGHRCVMYTDVDEMLVAPNRARFPRGLHDLLVDFSSDPKQQHWRGMGYNVGHVSESEDAAPALEAPLDWSRSVMQQRSHWKRNERYDKPLLSKITLHWKPGFHQTFPPPHIMHHDDLYLLHLPEVDKSFCLAREQKKYEAMKIAHDWEKGGGFNNHIANMPSAAASGKLCRYARAVYVKHRNATLDNTGTDVLATIPEAFKLIDI